MDSLIKDLQKTIEALETLSAQPATACDQIDELLDQLFQQKIDLVNASPSVSFPPFQQAAKAMKQAALKADRAVKEPSRLDETIRAVSDAISQLAKLLDSLRPTV